MTLQEYTASLEGQGLSKDQKIEKIKAWKVANPPAKDPVTEVAKTKGAAGDVSVVLGKNLTSGSGPSPSPIDNEDFRPTKHYNALGLESDAYKANYDNKVAYAKYKKEYDKKAAKWNEFTKVAKPDISIEGDNGSKNKYTLDPKEGIKYFNKKSDSDDLVELEGVNEITTASLFGHSDFDMDEFLAAEKLTEEVASTDPYAEYLITEADIDNDESVAMSNINSKLARVGISSSEGTSWGSTNALSFSSSKDKKSKVDQGVILGGITDLFEGLLPSSSNIEVGKGRTPEETKESLEAINAYIRKNGDLGFVDKARKRSGKAYMEYEDFVTAPVVEKAELISTMKANLVNKFEDVRVSKLKGIGFKEAPATIDDFDNEDQLAAYKQWSKDGFIQDFTDQEIAAYDAERIQK